MSIYTSWSLAQPILSLSLGTPNIFTNVLATIPPHGTQSKVTIGVGALKKATERHDSWWNDEVVAFGIM